MSFLFRTASEIMARPRYWGRSRGAAWPANGISCCGIIQIRFDFSISTSSKFNVRIRTFRCQYRSFAAIRQRTSGGRGQETQCSLVASLPLWLDDLRLSDVRGHLRSDFAEHCRPKDLCQDRFCTTMGPDRLPEDPSAEFRCRICFQRAVAE